MKSLSAFIKENRSQIDSIIIKELTRYDSSDFKRKIRLNDKDRRGWILNDEFLYGWALRENVKV